MESEPMLTPREIPPPPPSHYPLTGGSEEGLTCDAASCWTASPTHYPLSYSGLFPIHFTLCNFAFPWSLFPLSFCLTGSFTHIFPWLFSTSTITRSRNEMTYEVAKWLSTQKSRQFGDPQGSSSGTKSARSRGGGELEVGWEGRREGEVHVDADLNQKAIHLQNTATNKQKKQKFTE